MFLDHLHVLQIDILEEKRWPILSLVGSTIVICYMIISLVRPFLEVVATVWQRYNLEDIESVLEVVAF